MKSRGTDYSKYILNKKELLIYGGIFVFACSLIGILMYNNYLAGLLASLPLLPVFYKRLCLFLNVRRKKKLEDEFCKFIQLSSTSLAGGTALDNVFREVAETVPHERKGKSMMIREYLIIDRLISLNYDACIAFSKFADRSDSSNIQSLSKALSSVTELGGDLANLFKGGASTLRLKQETEREINRKMSLPKMNHRILTCMPFAFIFLLRETAPDSILCLYSGTGNLIMSFVLVLTALAWLLGGRIGKVNV